MNTIHSAVTVRPARAYQTPTPRPARAGAVLSGLTLASAVAVCCLLAWLALGSALAPSHPRAANTRPTLNNGAPVNPLLIIQPRTETQEAHAGALRLALTAGPLIPGPNHLVVAISGRERASADARVGIVAAMPGMLMRPLTISMRPLGGGRFAAVAPLSMFGSWRISIIITPRHGTAIVRSFTVGLDLPTELLRAVGAQATSH